MMNWEEKPLRGRALHSSVALISNRAHHSKTYPALVAQRTKRINLELRVTKIDYL